MSDPDESEVVASERAASVEASRDDADFGRWIAGAWRDHDEIPTGDEIA